MRHLVRHAVALAALLAAVRPAAAAFTEFESGPVRPLAMSPDGTRLFACNTPDDTVDIFSIGVGGTLTRTGSVTVGLEPVAVATRGNNEIWVVNHLSDSVSIVDVTPGSPPRVTRTLLVGDEPRDIVFAGPGGNRAFITTARRGQNLPATTLPKLTTASTAATPVGRALVFVFDATSLGAALGGTPLTVLELFTDTPRALAVSPDGNTVYAAGFHTGNQTTTVNEGVVCNGGPAAPPCTVSGTTYPGGLPGPRTDANNTPGPETGQIVKFNGTHWVDPLGHNWDPAVKFTLPDRDVFAINATLSPPAVVSDFTHVGTVLFNMITNPANGNVYVTNSDANNATMFEGPGVRSGGVTVRGHIAEMRVTVLSGTTVTPRHLNKHIDYSPTAIPSPASTAAKSLATPTAMAITGNTSGTNTLYVAAFGSSKIGVFDTTQLENDTFTPSAANQIPVSGGGPSGLVLDAARQRLYVATRFDDGISVIDTSAKLEVSHVGLHNPEPLSVVDGRPVLYDALLTSSNGEAACASCHIFGDFDSLAWNLGNPDDVQIPNNNPFRLDLGNKVFHPLKGPMTTQSLRGMANNGPMHWRGDRSGANSGGDALDESLAFKAFIVAFSGLLGHNGPISNADMDRFTNFILQVQYPPNPVRNLDNSLTTAQQNGRNFYMNTTSDTLFTCNGCHVLNPALGQFGTDGFTTFENETQNMKIPHLRNMYQKVGMFGFPASPFLRNGNNGPQGDQVRGFGFLHDGSVDTLFRFHGATVFTVTDQQRSDLEQFVLAFDSNLAPIVGQQITLTSTNSALVGPRIDLMIQRAAAGECDLVVKGIVAGVQRGAVRLANGTFKTDRSADGAFTDAQLRGLAATPGQEATYTCTPPGSGRRVGVDRDEDGCLDFDDTAPADPLTSCSYGGSTTTSTTTTTTTTTSTTTTTLASALLNVQNKKTSLRDRTFPVPDPTRRKFSWNVDTRREPLGRQVILPAAGGPDDPVVHGATLIVYNSAGLTNDIASVPLPSTSWSYIGSPTNVKGYRFRLPRGTVYPVSQVSIRTNNLAARAGGSGWPYSLNESQQGLVAVRLVLGSGDGWCTNVLPRVTSRGPADTVDRFDGIPNSPPAVLCPALP